MEIAAAAATPESCRGMSPPPSLLRSRQSAHGPVTDHGLGQVDGVEARHGPPLIGPAKVVGEQAGQLPVGPPGVGSPGLTRQPSPTGLASKGEEDEAIFKTRAHEATEKVAAAPLPGTHNRTPPALTQATGGSSPTADHTSPHSDRLGNLFKAVTPPLLDRLSSTPPAKSRPILAKRCRIARLAEYCSTNPRRSSRLAGKSKMPPMQKCHRVLMKRLGLLRTDASLDEVLAEYVAMFNGPLPPHIIAALTSIFDLTTTTTAMVTSHRRKPCSRWWEKVSLISPMRSTKWRLSLLAAAWSKLCLHVSSSPPYHVVYSTALLCFSFVAPCGALDAARPFAMRWA
ncbi:Os03g0199900 [Oryza sativa Japonica Group]|nr:hypothetical protein OsJ_09797 [Oryza sativa Japonica Group]BAS82806.1 Os03g0199900 [Oryza sativa Japonica Group]